MSGHNKWSTIKRKKGKLDAQRGRIFTRLIKEITVAARMGGGDPESNTRLRTAVSNAKSQNMPQDNITRAIKKGTGELPGVNYEEVVYEGYGPGGTAIMVEAMTDNKNRTTAEMRHIFSKYGGNLGAQNCVSWMFDKKGPINVACENATEDSLLELLMEYEIDDITSDEEFFSISMVPDTFDNIKKILEDNNIPIANSEITMIPQNMKELDLKESEKMVKLLDMIEENDDTQNVYSNCELSDDLEA